MMLTQQFQQHRPAQQPPAHSAASASPLPVPRVESPEPMETTALSAPAAAQSFALAPPLSHSFSPAQPSALPCSTEQLAHLQLAIERQKTTLLSAELTRAQLHSLDEIQQTAQAVAHSLQPMHAGGGKNFAPFALPSAVHSHAIQRQPAHAPTAHSHSAARHAKQQR